MSATKRRVLVWSGVVAAVVFAIGVSLVIYAFFNLTAIVNSHQHRIIDRVSAALGRAIKVQKLTAHAGWGISVSLSDATIADDPAFSKEPFIAAEEVSAELDLIPMLHGEVWVKRVAFIKPNVRILMNADGDLNLDSLGSGPGSATLQNETHAKKRSALADVTIDSLSVEDGSIYFIDLDEQGAPIQLDHVTFDLTNFSATAPFDVAMKGSFLGAERNFDLSGKMGPLLTNGVLDLAALQLDLKFTCDDLKLDSVRTLTDIGPEIPAQLSISDAFPVNGIIKGSWREMPFTIGADLTAHRVIYGTTVAKPAGTRMVINASGTVTDQFDISSFKGTLADLELTASNISIPDDGPISAQVDTNSFNLASVAPIIRPVAGLDIAGNAELHGKLKLVEDPPDLDGTVNLKDAAIKPGPSWPIISHLSGDLGFHPGHAVTENATFAIGSSNASLNAQVVSLNPLNMSYTINSAALKPADLFSGSPSNEALNQVVITGTADGVLSAPRLNAAIKSPDGQLADIEYGNLDITAAYKNDQLVAIPLRMNLLDGSLSAQIDLTFGARPHFTISSVMNNLNVEQGLRSQRIGAADTVHGFLSGNVAVAGSGTSWDRIKPTLRGSGRLSLANGKLIGVNIVADAINAVARAPGVSQIVQVAFSPSHRGLLVDPNTELRSASMSFQLLGDRFTTHDLTAESPDYGIRGDGWFDMEKHLDMRADILLTFGVQVPIPVTVSGKLPDVHVLPDIPMLAEHIAVGTVTAPARILEGGVSAVGTLMHRGSSSSSNSSSSPMSNPINSIKGWFH